MFRKTKKAVALAMATLLTVHTAPELVVNAATTGWELVVREETPVDRVYFDTVDVQTGECYLIGYKDNKVAIVDMGGKLVAKTNYTGVSSIAVHYGGKTALPVEQNGMVGLMNLQGQEVLACTYQDIRRISSYEGHTVVRYVKTDGSSMLKIDDTYVLEGVSWGYLEKYNGELVVVVYRTTGDSTYDIYDLTGQKKNTISWEQLQKGTSTDYTDDMEDETVHSYCNKAAGKEAYEKAKEEWLLAKESALIEGAEVYFSGTDMIFSKKNMFSGYQCVGGKMYYCIVAEGELTKKLSDAEADHFDEDNTLATIQYVQIYDEERKLISEGQTSLSKYSITGDTCNEAIPFLVYVLDKEGALLKLDAENGSMEKVYDWKKGAVFCEKYDCNNDVLKRYNKQAYVYEKNYVTVSRLNTEPDLSITYQVNAMISINGEKCIYFPLNKSIETYDIYNSKENLFFKSTEDNQTEIYGISTKAEKLCTIKESIASFNNEEDSWRYSSFYESWNFWDNNTNEAYCLVNKTKGKMYFVGKGFGIIENCKDNFAKDTERILGFGNNEKYAFAFSAASSIYDESENKSSGGDESEYRIAFLDCQNQSIEWKNMPAGAYDTFCEDYRYVSSDKICYAKEEQKIYYIDFAKSECKEINLANTMVEKAGTVEGLSEIEGELHIRYSVTDEKKYYGYADLSGNIIYDAAMLKADILESQIKKYGDYTMYGDILLDKENRVISKNASCRRLSAYDAEEKEYVPSDLYMFYPDVDSEDASADFGFIFDKMSNKVIFDFKDSVKKNHYGVVDTKNKCYYAFLLDDKQAQEGNTTVPKVSKKPTGTTAPQVTTAPQETTAPQATTNSGVSASTTPAETKAPQQTKAPVDTVQKGKSYVVGKQTYKVTDATEKTVTFTKTSNKGSSETIPAEVKIKGATYKVTAIADKVYQGNKKIKKIVIGSNVKSIGKNVWKGCKNLTTIQIKSKVLTKVGGSAIKGTSKKLKITVPSGKKKAYQKLWKGKGNDKAKIK